VNVNLLLSLMGTAAVLLKRSLGTADGVQGRGGYTNGYGDVTGAVIRAVGGGRKTVIPSEVSCQPLDGFREAGGIVVVIVDVAVRDDSGCGELDTTGGASDGDGVWERGVVLCGFGDSVEGKSSNAGKRS
jgi:hypothetical protein